MIVLFYISSPVVHSTPHLICPISMLVGCVCMWFLPWIACCALQARSVPLLCVQRSEKFLHHSLFSSSLLFAKWHLQSEPVRVFPLPSLPVLAFDPSRFLPTPTIPPPLCLCLSVSLSLSLSLYLFPSLTNTFSLSPSPSLPWRFVSSSSPLPLPLPLGDPRENSKTGTRSLNEKS